jgi:hypothetical protein
MKPGTFILSFLFVILTVQPMFIKWNDVPCTNDISCSNKIKPAKNILLTGCCKKNVAKKCPSKKQDNHQPENPCNTCNPFMPCNACGYMPEETRQFISPVASFNADNTIDTEDFIYSTYDADCWHPPELFSIL